MIHKCQQCGGHNLTGAGRLVDGEWLTLWTCDDCAAEFQTLEVHDDHSLSALRERNRVPRPSIPDLSPDWTTRGQ